MNRKSVILVLFVLSVVSAKAQWDFPDPSFHRIETMSNRLSLDIDATTFFRNAEFYLRSTKGYTASGFRLTPMMRYKINEKAQIRGGVVLTGIAGTEGFWKVQPALTIDYKPAHWMMLTMGTLDGCLHHDLGEPLYDVERWVFDNKEDGLQIQTETRHWVSDNWINWEHFLEPWTPDQERFTMGFRHMPRVRFGRDDLFEIALPAMFFESHRGGQLSTLDTCIETLFHERVGLDFEFPVCGLREPEKRGATLPADHIRIETPFYFFQNVSPSPHTEFLDGWGFYPQLTYAFRMKSHEVRATAGYWYGHQFLSARGSFLFQSVSCFDIWWIHPERRMVTFKFNYLHLLEGNGRDNGFALDIDIGAYHDIESHRTDLVFGLYLRLKKEVRLL